MITESATSNKTPLSLGAKAFVAVAAIASVPGYLLVLILISSSGVESIVGSYYHSPLYDRVVQVLRVVVLALPILGILTHPLALLVAAIGSFLGIGKRAKILLWIVVLGGILSLQYGYWVVWVRYQ